MGSSTEPTGGDRASREHPSFSIVIPTYNRSDVVEQTLRQLLAQDYPADRFEILVCDNSADDTPNMVRRVAADAPATVTLISSDERLPAVKRNQGLDAATGDFVLFMNDDVWVLPDFLAEHAATHAAHDVPIAVLGKVEQSPKMERNPFIEWYEPFAYHLIDHLADQAVPYHFGWSMNLSFPRRVMLDRNIRFHEDWREIGSEDVEISFRWTRAGYPIIYNPRAWGEHFHPHDLDTACRLQEVIGRGVRDLEALVPDPGLLERYGIFSARNSPRAVVRGVVRGAIFNRWTVPLVQPRLQHLRRRSPVAEWAYWKVMLFHTNRGYRNMAPSSTTPLPTAPLSRTSA
ncbi:MAG: glycosyltransferase family A protein [Microthrixaceae bacterium]